MRNKNVLFMGILIVVLILVTILFVLLRSDYFTILGGEGDDRIFSSVVLADGSFVTVGWTDSVTGDIQSSNGTQDGLIMKYDAEGKLLWYKTYGGEYDDQLNGIYQLKDGNLVVLGIKGTNFQREGYVLVIDQNGNKIRENTYGHYHLRSLIELRDGSLILTGDGNDDNESYGYIIKVDSIGNLIWEKHVVGYGFNMISLINDDFFLVAGSTYYTDENNIETSLTKMMAKPRPSNLILLKFDMNGNIISQKIHEMLFSTFTSIAPTKDGNYIISGTQSSGEWFFPSRTALLIKINSDGEILSNLNEDSSRKYQECIIHLNQTNDGYLAVGYKYQSRLLSYGDFQAWIVKLDLDGNRVWEQTIERKPEETFYTVVETKGVIYAFGDSMERDKDYNIIFSKYNLDGKNIK